MKFILASKSPRRKELLEQIGMEFDIVVSDADENIEPCSPELFVEKLSCRKAEAVANQIKMSEVPEEGITIIGSDTVVVYNGEIMGKPVDRADALRMMGLLSGNTHEVYTGVTLIVIKDGEKKFYSFHECTKVTMYEMTEKQLQSYVNSGEGDDKAGSYGIQGLCGAYIKEIQGEYASVVGLPIARICHELTLLNIDWMK